jgi:hypothetical protein
MEIEAVGREIEYGVKNRIWGSKKYIQAKDELKIS